jgi:hypothetical protein
LAVLILVATAKTGRSSIRVARTHVIAHRLVDAVGVTVNVAHPVVAVARVANPQRRIALVGVDLHVIIAGHSATAAWHSVAKRFVASLMFEVIVARGIEQ